MSEYEPMPLLLPTYSLPLLMAKAEGYHPTGKKPSTSLLARSATLTTATSLLSAFHVAQRLRVELLGEAFNIMNHANYNGYNSTAFNSVATTAATPINTPIGLIANSNFRVANNDGSQPDGTNAAGLGVTATPFLDL